MKHFFSEQSQKYGQIGGLLHVSVFVFLLLLLSTLFGLVLHPFVQASSGESKQLLMLAMYVFPFGFSALSAHVLFRKELALSSVFCVKSHTLLIYLLSVIFVLLSGIIIEPVFSILPMPESMKKGLEEVLTPGVGNVLSVCVAAPVLEEWFFRGLIQNRLMKDFSATTSILLSAFIFGAIHLNPWQFFAAFFIGLFFGWIFAKTGSLWPSILAHAANNSFSFGMANITENKFITMRELIPSDTLYYCCYAAAALVCVLVILVLRKHFSGHKPGVAI